MVRGRVLVQDGDDRGRGVGQRELVFGHQGDGDRVAGPVARERRGPGSGLGGVGGSEAHGFATWVFGVGVRALHFRVAVAGAVVGVGARLVGFGGLLLFGGSEALGGDGGGVVAPGFGCSNVCGGVLGVGVRLAGHGGDVLDDLLGLLVVAPHELHPLGDGLAAGRRRLGVDPDPVVAVSLEVVFEVVHDVLYGFFVVAFDC